MATAIRFTRNAARHAFPNRHNRGTKFNATHIGDVEVITDRTNRFVVEFPDVGNRHIVDLAANEGEFLAACTCKDFGYRDVVCKHIFAVLAEPSARVKDHDATRNPKLNPETAISVTSKRLIADGGAATMPEPVEPVDLGNGNAPMLGDLVEAAFCRRFDLKPVDGTFFDARSTEKTTTKHFEPGTPIQIKGCQRRIRNGYDEHGNQAYTPGRFTLWEEDQLNLMMDRGRYLFAVYDEDEDPSDIQHFAPFVRVLTPEEVAEAVDDGSWYDADRPSKGKRAKVTWTRLFGRGRDV